MQANLKCKDKTIVLIASFIPLLGFGQSDAAFNLGYAVAQVEVSPPGIYICMNAKTFTPEEVAKSIPEGRYFSVFGENKSRN